MHYNANHVLLTTINQHKKKINFPSSNLNFIGQIRTAELSCLRVLAVTLSHPLNQIPAISPLPTIVLSSTCSHSSSLTSDRSLRILPPSPSLHQRRSHCSLQQLGMLALEMVVLFILIKRIFGVI